MIATDFILIPPESALADAVDWDYTSDSPSTALVFTAGSNQPRVMKTDTTGEQFAAYSLSPARPHQRAAFRARNMTTVPAEAYVGVFCRYADKNNCVIARVNLNTFAFQVIERIDGVQTVIGTSSGSFSLGCAMVVEVIGFRVRWWISRTPTIPTDVPPDGAADLAGEWQGAADPQWGLYWKMGGANSVEIERFEANELADQVLPPPTLRVNNATNLALSPVTISVGSLAAGTKQWDLEISSLDSQDFVETFAASVEPSVTSLVVYLRPGYRYGVRTREVRGSGTPGNWVPIEITVTGSRHVPAGFAASTWRFPDLPPDYALDRTQEASLSAMIAEGGRESVVALQGVPRNRWSLRYAYRTQDEARLVLAFHARMRGQVETFDWAHPTSGRIYRVRFASDDLRLTINEVSPDNGNLVDFEFDLVEAPPKDPLDLADDFGLDTIGFQIGDTVTDTLPGGQADPEPPDSTPGSGGEDPPLGDDPPEGSPPAPPTPDGPTTATTQCQRCGSACMRLNSLQILGKVTITGSSVTTINYLSSFALTIAYSKRGGVPHYLASNIAGDAGADPPTSQEISIRKNCAGDEKWLVQYAHSDIGSFEVWFAMTGADSYSFNKTITALNGETVTFGVSFSLDEKCGTADCKTFDRMRVGEAMAMNLSAVMCCIGRFLAYSTVGSGGVVSVNGRRYEYTALLPDSFGDPQYMVERTA